MNSLRYSCCCYHWPRCRHIPCTCSSGIFSYTNQFSIQVTPSKFSPTGDNDTDKDSDRGSDQGSLAIRGVDLCLPSSSPSCLPIRQLRLELGRHKSTPRIANEPWSKPLSVSFLPVGENLEGVSWILNWLLRNLK